MIEIELYIGNRLLFDELRKQSYSRWDDWAASHNGIYDTTHPEGERDFIRVIRFDDEQDAIAFKLKFGL